DFHGAGVERKGDIGKPARAPDAFELHIEPRRGILLAPLGLEAGDFPETVMPHQAPVRTVGGGIAFRVDAQSRAFFQSGRRGRFRSHSLSFVSGQATMVLMYPNR